MLSHRHLFRLPLCAALLAALATPLSHAGTKPIVRADLGPVAYLTQTSPTGSATVRVDGGGNFTEAFVYTSADETNIDMSYESSLYFDGANYFPAEVDQTADNKAKSRFTAGSLEVDLKQDLATGSIPGSYILTQKYRLSNPGTEPVSVNVGRYNDSDIGDYGYQPPSGRFNYIVSNAMPSGDTITGYVGVKLVRGSEVKRVVRICCRNTGDILPEEQNTVPNDVDLDGISDSSADMAIYSQESVTVPAGGVVNVKTVTYFGRSAINSLSALPAR